MIAFACPSCGKALTVKDELGGKRASCPQCQKVVVVPVPPSGATQALGSRPAEPPTRDLGPKRLNASPAPALDATAGLAGNSPAQAAESAGESLDFLTPAQGPGELGRLGSYRVLKVLGAGGMGLVLQAEDPLLKRSVALKVMRPEVAATAINRQRFLREAQATAAVEHPYIVHIHQVGEERGVPFLAMPMLRGEPLDARLKREGKLPLADAVRIARQVAEGLAAAHEHGLIHRDIKPGNIWLEDRTGFVKILDFGLARASGDIHLTQTGTVVGTPAYMAPEQARSQVMDERCDLFSLGAVLYRMLTGELPFKGHDTMSLLMALATDTPPPLRSLDARVPPALDELVMRLLEKKPQDRPQTAQEVVTVLAQFGGDMTAAMPRSAPARQVDPDARTEAAKRVPPARKRLPLRWLIGGGVVGLGLLGLLVLLLSRPGNEANRGGRSSQGNGQLNPGPAPALAIAPFDAPQALAHQEAWAKYLGVPVEYTNKAGMKFRLIPPGEFTMGLTEEEFALFEKRVDVDTRFLRASRPAHDVRLTKAYYLGEREIRLADFLDVMKRPPGGIEPPGNDSVQQFCTWFDCVEFCNRLSERDKLTPAYRIAGETVTLVPDATGYRLPSEAEWEFACRAGTTTLWYYGLTLREAEADFDAAGQRQPQLLADANPFGLFQMYGFGSEWCWDWANEDYFRQCAAKGLVVDPLGPPAGRQKVVRGGTGFSNGGKDLASINSAARALTSPHFDRDVPANGKWTGFGRVVLPVPTKGELATSPSVAPKEEKRADWLHEVAALPAAKQVEEVRKELMRRNPKLDGVVEPTFENDAVTGLKFSTFQVTNIAPVCALTRLHTLNVGNWPRGKGVLADLSPLKGLALVKLNCSSTKVSDLSPLRGMKLQVLEAMDTEASDLTPLQGMPLKHLDLAVALRVTSLQPLQGMPLDYLNLSNIPLRDLSLLAGMPSLRVLVLHEMPVFSDLTPLRGLKLRYLGIMNTQVSDLSPLRGMELESVNLTPRNITKGLDVLRDMKSLKTIGVGHAPTAIWPPAEFWARYDKGEFKK